MQNYYQPTSISYICRKFCIAHVITYDRQSNLKFPCCKAQHHHQLYLPRTMNAKKIEHLVYLDVDLFFLSNTKTKLTVVF